MTDAKMLEAWLRLSADAVRGTEQAREAMRMLGIQSPDAGGLQEWIVRWFPTSSVAGGGRTAGVAADPQELLSMAQEWWQGLGVVPRHQYTEALRRCEELTRRLEEAEKTIARLRQLAAADRDAETGEAIKGALDSWQELTRKALEAQAEWARTWVADPPGDRGDTSEQ